MNDDNDDTTYSVVLMKGRKCHKIKKLLGKTVGTNFFLVGPANGGGLP